jgi:hypothetical protein
VAIPESLNGTGPQFIRNTKSFLKAMNNNSKSIIPWLAVAAIVAGTLVSTAPAFGQATLILSGTSYSQNFDDVANGLPDGWSTRAGATASQVGTLAAFATAHKDWGTPTAGFANYASTTNNEGTAFVGDEPATTQTNAVNRAAGVRQTGTAGSGGDPGAAFVLRIDNTIGMGNFQISLDLLMLSVQARSTVWTIDYAVGNAPGAFTPLVTFSDPGVFGTTKTNFSAGSVLNNQTENVWIRIVALTPSTGAGSRDTFGIDNFQLAWTPVSTDPDPPHITGQPQSRTNVAGTTATFSVAVSGTAPFTFQWRKGNDDLFDGPTASGSTISGAATASLSISSVRTDDAGNYSVRIMNSVNSTNSEAAVLTVNQPVPVFTNIAYLRTKMDPVEFNPIDTTTLYAAEGIVTTPVNLTTPANAQFYMQDNTGGIAVFVLGGAAIRPAQGDRVRVTGPLGHFNGLFELNLDGANFTHSVEILSSGNPLPQPALFNFATLANVPTMEASVEGSYLVISNVFLQNAGSTFGSGVNYRMTNLNGLTAELRIDTRALDVIGQTIPAFASSIKGVMGQFDGSAPHNTGYQFFLTLYSDLVAGTPPAPSANPIPLDFGVNGANLVLTWTNASFNLQAAPAVSGTYTNIPGATSPHPVPLSGDQRYFRLVQPVP